MKAHWPLYPTGPAPWSPWVTACGRLVSELNAEDEPHLAEDDHLVTCKTCLRSEVYRDRNKTEEPT